jgi:hypothetical protein
MGPVFDINLRLTRFFHSTCEHSSEVLALGREDSLVGKYLFSLYHKNNIRKLRVIYDLSHILDQTVDSLVVYFVFFQFADVQNADIVKPLATVKASKNK